MEEPWREGSQVSAEDNLEDAGGEALKIKFARLKAHLLQGAWFHIAA